MGTAKNNDDIRVDLFGYEIGKNNIDSRTFLSGTFALDKSVKFQDRGV